MSIDPNHIRSLIRKALADYSYYESTRTISVPVGNDSYTNQKHDRALDDLIRELKARCDERWRRLEELQSQAMASQKSLDIDVSSTQTQRLAILKVEERRLQCEIELQNKEVNKVEKKPPEVVRLLVKRQILDSIDQYHETLPLLRGEMKETEEALVREKEVLKECDAIAEVLRAKLEELRQSSGQVQNTNLSQARKELSELKKRNGTIMGELVNFIDENYPPHHSTPKRKSQRRRNKVDDVEPEEQEDTACSLKDILEELMNLSISSPGDPYLALTPGNFWPPYVELLVKAGIATRHPRDAMRLKLVDFHL